MRSASARSSRSRCSSSGSSFLSSLRSPTCSCGDTRGSAMKRFLPPNELARDSRFKRAGSRNQLVPSLPDDVDQVLAQAVDFVLADELTHVRFGSDWVREFTRDDPARAQRAAEFQRETDTRFSFGTRAVAREERIEAGFTEEELRQLDEILDKGPKRKTLVDAALILKDRHQARLRGEAVAPY